MAKAIINLQKESGGIVKISPVDGIGITEVTVPESGTLATEEYVNSEIGAPNSPLVKTALNASGEAPIYACRAWVNFNGTGTVAIRASGNVSSITDNGVGDYTVNFTTSMPDVSYAISGIAGSGNGRWLSEYNGTFNATDSTTLRTESSCRVAYISDDGVLNDNAGINVSIFR